MAIATLPTIAHWLTALDSRPGGFTYLPPTSDTTAYDLVSTLMNWYAVILFAIPVVIVLISLRFPLRTVILIAALLLLAGSGYSLVLGDRFISWGYGFGGDLDSTYGLALIAYAACYALSAVSLLLAGSVSDQESVRDAAQE